MLRRYRDARSRGKLSKLNTGKYNACSGNWYKDMTPASKVSAQNRALSAVKNTRYGEIRRVFEKYRWVDAVQRYNGRGWALHSNDMEISTPRLWQIDPTAACKIIRRQKLALLACV